MRKETISQYLLRRLDASAGMHAKIAKDCGVAQATISRIYTRKVSPRLDIAEPILAWFDRADRAAERKKSASGPAIAAKRVTRRSAIGTAASLRQ